MFSDCLCFYQGPEAETKVPLLSYMSIESDQSAGRQIDFRDGRRDSDAV